MAGKGTLSANQTPNYGDKKQLQKMTSLTKTPMTGVPVERKGAGRPQGSTRGGSSTPTPQQGVTSGQKGTMTELAKATKLVRYWFAVNDAAQTQESKMNLLDAQEHLEKVSNNLRTSTPFW